MRTLHASKHDYGRLTVAVTMCRKSGRTIRGLLAGPGLHKLTPNFGRWWLYGESATLNWQSNIWPVVALQVASIATFTIHAGRNKPLAQGELGGWVLEFVILIPFGMLGYWNKHVRNHAPHGS